MRVNASYRSSLSHEFLDTLSSRNFLNRSSPLLTLYSLLSPIHFAITRRSPLILFGSQSSLQSPLRRSAVLSAVPTYFVTRLEFGLSFRVESTAPGRLERTAAVSSDNGNSMFQVPSLLKTAYQACNKVERARYDSLRTRDVDLRRCCEALFAILKGDYIRRQIQIADDDDRETMYDRSLFPIGDQRFHRICEFAASYGHIDCLRLAREIGVPWDTSFRPNDHPDIAYDDEAFGTACDGAAKSGSLECLRYALENGCPMGDRTCNYAALNGHLDCLEFAHDNGFPWDEDTCSYAAFNGHLDCLVYARDNGCPWDESTCDQAAFNGHLDCLVYARDNGCPWGHMTSINAKINGHMDCLDYALKNGCPWNKRMYNYVASNNYIIKN